MPGFASGQLAQISPIDIRQFADGFNEMTRPKFRARHILPLLQGDFVDEFIHRYYRRLLLNLKSSQQFDVEDPTGLKGLAEERFYFGR